jgi:hypothetical protein
MYFSKWESCISCTIQSSTSIWEEGFEIYCDPRDPRCPLLDSLLAHSYSIHSYDDFFLILFIRWLPLPILHYLSSQALPSWTSMDLMTCTTGMWLETTTHIHSHARWRSRLQVLVFLLTADSKRPTNNLHWIQCHIYVSNHMYKLYCSEIFSNRGKN